MKIFLASASFDASYGGPAYSVARLAEALAAEGANIGIWAPDRSAETAPGFAADASVRRLGGSARDALAEFGAPDVIHDSGVWLPHNHRLAAVAHERGIARVVSTRGMLEPWAMAHKRIRKWIAWRTYQRRDLSRASGIHTTTTIESVNVRALNPGIPVTVIPNGVDIAARMPAPSADHADPRRVATFLGRLYPVKGLPTLLDAWALARPAGWRLVIAGPDEAGHLSELAAQVTRLGLSSDVTFTGPVQGEAKSRTLFASELLILPSFSESFGMVVAEALAHGVPVLTTTAVPWPMLESSGAGWQVPPDAPGLAAGIRVATAQGGESLRRMGDRGRDLVAGMLHWPAIAAKFLALYDSLTLQARTRSP